MSGMIDVPPQTAAARDDRLLLRIDADVFDRRQVDDEPVVDDAQPAGIVAAATDGQQHLLLAGESHGGHDVGYVGTASDQARPPVDHAVVDLANRVVVRRLRIDQLSPKSCPQSIHCCLSHHHVSPSRLRPAPEQQNTISHLLDEGPAFFCGSSAAFT
jgi:hypothetical protein